MNAANTVPMPGDVITWGLVMAPTPVKVTAGMRRADRTRGKATRAGASRRVFLGAFAVGLAGPSIVWAQGRAPRVGVVGLTPNDPSLGIALADGLRQSGYDDGRTVAVD